MHRHRTAWLERRLGEIEAVTIWEETNMGWIISVGKAGAKGRAAGAQALSLHIDAPGMAARVRVFPHADRTPSGDAGSMPVWQAQRVWQNLLSALVGP